MAVEFTTLLLKVLGFYILAGLLFAPFFLVRGARSIDPVASGGTWGFRAMIFPGVVALWPLLLMRWMSGANEPPEEAGAHRCAGTRDRKESSQ